MLQTPSSRKQDLGLCVLTLSAGPLLILCGRALAPAAAGPLPGAEVIRAAASQSAARLHRGSLQRLEELIGLAAVAGGLLLTLLTLISAATAAAAVAAERMGALRTGHVLKRLSPGFMRRSFIVTLSAHLAVGAVVTAPVAAHAAPAAEQGVAGDDHPSSSALFTPAGHHPVTPAPEGQTHTDQMPAAATFSTAETEAPMTPLFTPTAPAAPAERHQGAQQRTSPAEEDQITVRPGDTLWGLVAAELGAGATDWEIARDWPQWYEHNSAAIGDDPGSLAPGIVLDKPPAAR